MIPDISYDFQTSVWTYFNGKSTYYLASLPNRVGSAIQELAKGTPRRGWGSIPVIITIGSTRWHSSIFPQSGGKTYLFLINAKVRKAEAIEDTSRIQVNIALRD